MNDETKQAVWICLAGIMVAVLVGAFGIAFREMF